MNEEENTVEEPQDDNVLFTDKDCNDENIIEDISENTISIQDDCDEHWHKCKGSWK